MHTVELLEQALDLVKRAGFLVRQEWLDGCGGGGCVLKGRNVLFLDLALGPAEQLDQVADALKATPAAIDLPMQDELRDWLVARRSA